VVLGGVDDGEVVGKKRPLQRKEGEERRQESEDRRPLGRLDVAGVLGPPGEHRQDAHFLGGVPLLGGLVGLGVLDEKVIAVEGLPLEAPLDHHPLAVLEERRRRALVEDRHLGHAVGKDEAELEGPGVVPDRSLLDDAPEADPLPTVLGLVLEVLAGGNEVDEALPQAAPDHVADGPGDDQEADPVLGLHARLRKRQSR